jgi:hypothetical protein
MIYKYIGMVNLKMFYFLFFTFFLSFISNDTHITWSTSRKLTWDDFKGKPDKSMSAAALTYTDIHVGASIVDGKTQVLVDNFFDTKLSWSKNKTSVALLAHEQLHFDITELYTRKIRKRLNEIVSEETIKNGSLSKESSKLLKQWKEFQLEYDTETNHGTIPDKQKEWEQKVTILLNE